MAKLRERQRAVVNALTPRVLERVVQRAVAQAAGCDFVAGKAILDRDKEWTQSAEASARQLILRIMPLNESELAVADQIPQLGAIQAKQIAEGIKEDLIQAKEAYQEVLKIRAATAQAAEEVKILEETDELME